MRVTVNGDPRELPESITIAEVVAATGGTPDGRGVAVAIDGAVVPRGEWAVTSVEPGQRVEVLQAVQGG